MTAKLIGITMSAAPPLPGLRAGTLTTIRIGDVHSPLSRWQFHVRGPSVLLVSPPGWQPGKDEREWEPGGARVIYELPRQGCNLHWSGEAADIGALTNYSPPGDAPTEEEMERLTAPKGKRA
ncbi:MAG: hypothetical protein ACTHU0_19195 [Kofleriaceae bacterium]